MSLNYEVAEAFARYGYSPDDPVRGLDVPARLIDDLGADCPCPPPFKEVAYCPDCPYRESQETA